MTTVSGKLQHQDWMVAPETQKLMAALLEDGGDARFVGGCVRNGLVNRKVIDVDIATPLTPDEVIERLKRHKISYAPTGLKHGTVTAIVDGHPFEVTTLRLDVHTYGRHADVQFTNDWQADASRRDFTINAIFATVDGDLYDPFGGVEDLRLGRVRFVGDAVKRIHEDFLRILRFFRFYAHFGQGEPDAAGLAACIAAAKNISKLSGERLRQETLKLLEADKCADVWKLMLHSGITTHFLPEAMDIAALEKLVQIEAGYHIPVFALRRLGALLAVTPEGLKHVVKALRFSNEQATQLLKMISPGVEVSAGMSEAAVRVLVYRFGNDMARNLLLLAAARAKDKENFEKLYQLATAFRAARFPLVGDDVLKLGYPPGPEVGKVLSTIEDWWISKDFAPGRTECLQLLQSQFKRAAN